MNNMTQKVQDRLIAGIKKFIPVLSSAKDKDINETDTVMIITDMLSEVFGYDKYSEITTEYVIKKTYCDLAIKVDGKVKFLIEVKAVGIDLKDEHIKQVIDYGANLGIEYVILTNGLIWKIFNINFGKPIDKELVYDFDFTKLNVKNQDDIELLFYVSREGLGKSVLEDYHAHKQAINRFSLGQILLTDSIVDSIRKELKHVFPNIKVENNDIYNILNSEVLKREVVVGEKADEFKKKINKLLNANNKAKEKKEIQKEEQK